MLRVFPHQLQAAWDRATYTGTGLAPVRVRNYDEMVRMVAQTPGAIGYISNEFDVTGNEERVRFIEVE
jgi:ABC-type phosphate transport system substrate-binding protein